MARLVGRAVQGAPLSNVAEEQLADRLSTRRIAQTRKSVNAAWLKAALYAVRHGNAPILAQFSASAQAEQLSLSLAEHDLVLVVCLVDVSPPPDRLLGFARGLEWLAREASASVVALLPAQLENRPELDTISFDSVRWEAASAILPADGPAFEENKHVIGPIIGRPHPGSPGEQLLTKRLAQDTQLGPMFCFNLRVCTIFDTRYLVDLVWAGGKVIVEVDGYGFHTARSAFNGDRERDYELTVSGYLVLRLPHDFVMQDVDHAVLRVRDFVNFRLNHPFAIQGTTS